jgi:single-stranded-DNA-specific exonuclease
VTFARSDSGELRGSARSIPGLHIRDAFDNIAANHPGMLVKFGGHAMAAGLTLAHEDLYRFASAFDEEARRWLGPDQLEQVVMTDGELGEEPSVPLFRSILSAAPWGQGFPEPVFDAAFEILEQRIVGGRHLKLKLKYEDTGRVVDAIAFNHDTLVEGRYQRMAYRVDINDYRGLESVQLIIDTPEVS